ncbi:MAG TPA: calcineurin-like phosphoesterase family protein [bacterium]|nr:calcineurin-like phosphoesterase family protein [bacterium]HPN34036.1 calcineurin-like phosphoesterase family protein [bacterium]
MSLNRWCVFIGLLASNGVFSQTGITGTVYLDANRNANRDHDELGVAGVCVSNGREVVRTDANGRWQLKLLNDSLIFVIKPSGYSVPVNEAMLPQHYAWAAAGSYREAGSRIDFALRPATEDSVFSVLLFGDPQARGMREVHFVARDVVQECIGTDAAFGVCLGDLVADDPSLFGELSRRFSQIGLPMYYTFGNHDHDRDAPDNRQSDRTFRRFFGPSTFAFEYGQAVFIVFKNVFYKPEGGYRAHLLEDQLAFAANVLSAVPPDKLVVLFMHIPIIAMDNAPCLFELLQDRPHTLSVSAHTHELANVFVDKKWGWHGAEPHHHFINGTVCGSWWCGLLDEQGIPHAVMNDGAPNGYAFLTIEGSRYAIRYKAARQPAEHQMNIYLPDELLCSQADSTHVLVNVFAGSSRSLVEMQLDHQTDWQQLTPVAARDPECLRMHQLNAILEQPFNGQALEELLGWKMDPPSLSRHMWSGPLPCALTPGVHTLTVRTKDMFGQLWAGHRVFSVRP